MAWSRVQALLEQHYSVFLATVYHFIHAVGSLHKLYINTIVYHTCLTRMLYRGLNLLLTKSSETTSIATVLKLLLFYI